MDVPDVLKAAWESVKKSGVPAPIQPVAFVEAVRLLREGSPTKQPVSSIGGQNESIQPAPTGPGAGVTEEQFFERLSRESGVGETDLRDVLEYGDGGSVHIHVPTRRLGENRRQQAQAVTALVAGARAYGLGERPVNSKAVIQEVNDKGCYDASNYKPKHLGAMTGFNRGTGDRIVPNSRWHEEFEAAVHLALGHTAESA